MDGWKFVVHGCFFSVNFRRVKHIPYIPIPSMYGIVTYIWLMFIVNVGRLDIPYMDSMGMKAFVVGWVYQVISHELLLITPDNLTYKALRMAKERCKY